MHIFGILLKLFNGDETIVDGVADEVIEIAEASL